MVVDGSKKKKRKYKKKDTNIEKEVISDNVVDEKVEKENTKELVEDTNNEGNKIENKETLCLENALENEQVIEALSQEEVITNDKKKFKKWKLVLLLVVLVLSLVLLGVIFFPRIELKGEDGITIGYNEKYVELGYDVYVLNKKINNKVKISSNIKDGILGNYEVIYSYSFFGFKIKKLRKVNIVDNVNPVLTTSLDEIKVCPNQEIPDIDYSAIDEYDGDITSEVEKIVTDNEVLFKVSDNSNNSSSVSVKVDRADREASSIKLKGNSSMFMVYGNTYKEPGYSASDNCSGDLTSKVVVSGSVGKEIGKYQIKYEVTDDSGNKTSVIRAVVVGVKVSDHGSINKGTIYLTFDDGPNQGTTNKILDILKSEGVKATFFVTCKGPDSLIKRMHDEGHTVGLHTASHNYSYVYSSVDNYFKDLYQVRDRVKRITGIDSKIIRFPGGSSNTTSRNYSKGIMTVLTNTVLNDGYRYFDWNVDGMDASSARSSRDVYYNVTSNLRFDRANVVLLHDIKSITVSALKDIIKFGREYGYEFRAIDMNTYMVRHNVNN